METKRGEVKVSCGNKPGRRLQVFAPKLLGAAPGRRATQAAMRLVNHSSELIHQIYQRERVDDVAQWRDAVKFRHRNLEE
jgi:hypothetical protein